MSTDVSQASRVRAVPTWAAHLLSALGAALAFLVLRDRLLDLGCDRGQGYLFGRPEFLLPVEAVPTLDG